MDARTAQSAEQQVYLHLRDQILNGLLSGGARIKPTDVAAELMVSRMPVREALRRLDAEGLVTIQPNRRAVVTSLTNGEVEELFEMRAVLEALALRFAVPKFTANELNELELLSRFMDQARNDPKTWVERHSQFHDFIVRVSGRQRLRKLIHGIHDTVHPYLLMYISVYNETEMVGAEHDSLVSVIRSGDPSAAEACIQDHIRSAAKGVIDFVSRHEMTATEPARDHTAISVSRNVAS